VTGAFFAGAVLWSLRLLHLLLLALLLLLLLQLGPVLLQRLAQQGCCWHSVRTFLQWR
jgi:hypothetical protein